MGRKIRRLGILFLILILTGCGKLENSGSANISDSGNASASESSEEPTVLTFGYIDSNNVEDLSGSIQERIVTFNKGQNEYYIEIVRYGEDNYLDGLNALNADISVGKAPDIMAIDDREFLRQLGEKGVIEDLNPFIDQDGWPQREDFVENVLPCFENDGKLYGMVPYFNLLTMIGNPEKITEERITFSQLRDLYEENKDENDILVYNGLTKYGILYRCIVPSLNEFIDMDIKTCNFEKEEFRELLEFSKQFEDMTDAGYYGDRIKNYCKLQERKMFLFFDGPINNFQDYTLYHALTGEGGRLVGFSAINGCSPLLSTNSSSLVINSDSKYKDVAWQFLCSFLEDNYLTSRDAVSFGEGFPVTKSGFELLAQKDMSGEYAAEICGASNLKGDTIDYVLDPATEEEIAYVREVIANAVAAEDYGEIEEIVGEEIVNYWNGTKSVEETMQVIQNRVQLYLDEQ